MRSNKNYFNDKCQEDLIQQIVDCRNNLAHGDDLKLDTNKAADISHAFMDFKQIVIEFFFGKIELSDFITNNFGFLNKVKLRNPPKNRKNRRAKPLKPLRKFKILSFRGVFLKNLGFL